MTNPNPEVNVFDMIRITDLDDEQKTMLQNLVEGQYAKCDHALRAAEEILHKEGIQPVFLIEVLLTHAISLSAALASSLIAEGHSVTAEEIYSEIGDQAQARSQAAALYAMQSMKG